jgi:hypothetical protein
MSLAHLAIIACPNGIAANGNYKYSLYLGPRLREPGSLDDYDVWRTWGQRVANLRFRLFDGNGQINTPVTITSPPADPTLWPIVFGANPAQWGNVNVEPYAFVDRSSTQLFGFRTDELARKLGDISDELALNGENLDRGALKLALDNAQVGSLQADGEAWLGQIGNDQELTAPDAEFHQSIRQLTAHPDLMRRLGLIVDVEIPGPGGGTVPTEAQFRSNYPFLPATGGPVFDFSSRLQIPVRMQIDNDNFPSVRLPEYRTGRWVNFDANKYVVEQGSSVEMINTLASLQRQVDEEGADDEQVSPPAVSEAGLSVSNVSVETMVLDLFNHQATVEDEINDWLRWVPGSGVQPLPPKVYAEDVGAGIRWDVSEAATQVFRSLHRRTAPAGYQFPRDSNLTVLPPDDEGWSSLAVSTDGTEQYQRLPLGQWPDPEFGSVQAYVDVDTTDWRVDGDMLLWDGWSLSVRRPGRAIDSNGQVATEDPNLPLPTDPAQVAVEYHAVPGTLERLRFDHTYRFRGRWVDLCGNSEPESATAAKSTSPSVTFGRTWPAPSPTVVRRSSKPVPGVGDHTTTIVIKSELNQSDNSTAPSDRMFFPPSVAQLRLERHGLPQVDGIDIADYNFLAYRDAQTLGDQLLIDPVTGESVAGDAVVGDEVTAGQPKQVAFYMPDPAARGVAFHDLPYAPIGRSPVVANGTWPNPESVILELRAGQRTPRLESTNRRLRVALPKGTIHESSVSSAIDQRWLPDFKAFDALPRNQRRRASKQILTGRNLAYSPRQAIKLVHAVRIPLDPPSFQPFTVGFQTADETNPRISGAINLHQATTDRIVVPCTWDGPVITASDPSGLTIGQVGAAVWTDSALAYPEPADPGDEASWQELRIELNDTKRHTLTFSAESFCRFSEYFTERAELTVTNGVAETLDSRGFDPLSVTVTDAAGLSVPFEESFTYDASPGAGTITADIDGLQGGLDIHVDYIPLPISRTSSEAPSNQTTSVLVKATAPPVPPIVEQVLPAFSRTVTETSNEIQVVHDGRVVRAHLAVPWNDSGEGELLGVAVKSDGSQTQWGRDATTVGAGTTAEPALADFTKSVAQALNVNGDFDVAGHDVAYDSARNVLTSDIALDATFSYRPFVKLYLCRYQPESISSARKSTVVATEVLRLGAQRTVTVTQGGANQVTVQLAGIDNVNQVTVRTEESDPAISDVEMSWQEVGSPVVLTRSGTRDAAQFDGTVTLPSTSNPRRLVIEDAEPVQRHDGAALVTEYEVAYREVIDIPAGW